MNTRRIKKCISRIQQKLYANMICAVYGEKIYISSDTAKRLKRGNKRTWKMMDGFKKCYPQSQIIINDDFFNRIWT